MNEIFKLSAALTAVCMVSGIVIAFTHSSTAKQIEAQKLREQMSALSQVFPTGAKITDTTGTPPLPSQYWIGRNETETIGYAFAVENRGYSGIIRYLVGIDTIGRVLGIKILSQTETPGLGARVEEAASGKSLWNIFSGNVRKNDHWFTEQFKGINICKPMFVYTSGEWPSLHEKIKTALTGANTVSAITGATISTRTIVSGLEKNIPAFYAALKGREQ